MNVENNRKRAARVLDIARDMAGRADKLNGNHRVSNRIEAIELNFQGFSEPGYDNEVGVALGNWNRIDRSGVNPEPLVGSDIPARVSALLEKLGLDVSWSDEWCSCSDCNKLFRTSGDSYSWQPSYVVGDGEVLCHECVEKSPKEHLAALEGRTDTCNTIETINPADYGYVRVSEHETGWHPGQTDNPVKVAAELEDRGISRYLFNLDANGQFDSRWSAWVHESQASALEDETEPGDLADELETGNPFNGGYPED